MNALGDEDEVGGLLRDGYAADVDPDFAQSLLNRLQKEAAPRRKRLWLKWAAVACLTILCGIAAVMYSRHTGPSTPPLTKAPDEGVGPLVVRGRVMRWDAPVMDFRIDRILQGTLDARTVRVDLSDDLDVMRRRLREDPARGADRALGEAGVDAGAETLFANLLNHGAATDMVIELSCPPAGPHSARKGRILSWGGVTDLPPRDRLPAPEDVTIVIVADGAAAAARPHPDNPLRDEWGMPR